MSNVVAFKPDRKGRMSYTGAAEAGADILFFTGIRYMRAEEDSEADDASLDEDATDGVGLHAEPGRDLAERLKA